VVPVRHDAPGEPEEHHRDPGDPQDRQSPAGGGVEPGAPPLAKAAPENQRARGQEQPQQTRVRGDPQNRVSDARRQSDGRSPLGALDQDRMIENQPAVPGGLEGVRGVRKAQVNAGAVADFGDHGGDAARVSDEAQPDHPDRQVDDRNDREGNEGPPGGTPEQQDGEAGGQADQHGDPLDRRRRADQDRAGQDAAPASRGDRRQEAPQDHAGQDPVRQRGPRIDEVETVGREKGRRQPARPAIPKQRARDQKDEHDVLQAEHQGDESPTERRVSEQHHAHANEQLAERGMATLARVRDADQELVRGRHVL
jgi:hypothetical protein